jgi:hypothetical protein
MADEADAALPEERILSLHDAAGIEVPWDWALFQPPAEDMPSAACLLSYLTETDAAGSESSWASVMRKLDSCKRGQEEHVQGSLVVAVCMPASQSLISMRLVDPPARRRAEC